MPWRGSTWYTFSLTSIVATEPSASGVYGIKGFRGWVYIGKSKDIRERLLRHLNGDNACILAAKPQFFAYELVAGSQRTVRQDELVLEYSPPCNRRLD